MKKILSFALIPFLTLSMFCMPFTGLADEIKGVTLYVSADGTPEGDGSEANPFGSIEAARDAVREMKSSSGLPEGGVTVVVKSGEYISSSSIVFGPEDSGTEESPVSYVSEETHGAKIRFSKTIDFSSFVPLDDSESSRIIDKDAASKVLKLDLAGYGITSSDMAPPSSEHRFDLSIDGAAMKYAEYPNGSFFRTPSDTGDSLHTSFVVDDDVASRIKMWQDFDKTSFYIFTTYEWATSIWESSTFDEENNTVKIDGYDGYGFGTRSRFRFINVMEEIDVPGEYYLDRENMVLYAYLPDGAENSLITVNVNEDRIVTFDDCEYISFTGFDLSGSRSDAVRIRGCRGITLDSLKIYNIGDIGIDAEGYDIIIQNCDISGTGADAIRIYGGDRQTLTSSGNLIFNNYIHDWAVKGKTYRPGVRIDGVGITVSHNEICNSLHFAIHYYGNDNIIEYNYIHDVVKDSSDAGAIYAGRHYAYYGNVIRYNYFCDIGNPDLGRAIAVYFDDGLSGQTAYGNIINRVYGKDSFAFMIGGGRDISVTNNIFIDIYDDEVISNCVSIDDRARRGYFNPDYWAGDPYGLVWQLEEVPYTTGIWAQKYPDLAKVKYVKGTFEDDDEYAFFNPAFVTVKNNAMYISGKGPRQQTVDASGFFFEMSQRLKSTIDISNNSFVAKNLSDFTDPESGNYKLKKDAAVFTKIPDFTDIPFEKIGLIRDTPEMNFSDVNENNWFYSAVEYAFAKGLMTGTSETEFSPNTPMTRAMLVTVLWRMENSPANDGKTVVPFDDLKADWYRDAVAWAYSNEIVNGVSDSKFDPQGKITREQIAAIMYRYSRFKGRDISSSSPITSFPDHAKTHEYAVSPMSWAVGSGLIAGVKSGDKLLLDPRGNATRAQVATILVRYLGS